MAFKGSVSGTKVTIQKGEGTLSPMTEDWDSTVTVASSGRMAKGTWDGSYADDVTEIDASASGNVTTIQVSNKLQKYSGSKNVDKVKTDGESAGDALKTVTTNAGNDDIEILKANSDLTVDAGAGNDKVNLQANAKSVNLGAGNDVLSYGVENVSGSTSDNVSVTLESADAGAGNDVINVAGETKINKAILGAGNDAINISGTVTNVDGSAGGNNKVSLSGAGISSAVVDAYKGGKGVDSVIADGSSSLKSIDLAAGNDYVKLSGERVVADTIKSDAGKNIIITEEGAKLNYYKGGTGIDSVKAEGQLGTIDLGAGNDYIQIGTSADSVIAGDGNDIISIAGGGEINLKLGNGNDNVYIASDANGTLKIDDLAVENKNSDKIYVDKDLFNAENISLAVDASNSKTSNITISLTTDGSVAGSNNVGYSIELAGKTNKDVIAIYDLKDASNKKATPLYQQAVLGADSVTTLDSTLYSNAPILLKSDTLKIVETDKKRAAMNLTVLGSSIESVTASGKADYINVHNTNLEVSADAKTSYNRYFGTSADASNLFGTAWQAQQVTINSGAGADTIAVRNGDNFYLADFAVGDNSKTADVINAVELGDARVIDYNDKTKDVTIGFLGLGTDNNVNFSTGQYAASVTIAKGLWDGITKNKGILIANDGKISTTLRASAPDMKIDTNSSKSGKVEVSYPKSDIVGDTINAVSYFDAKGPLTVNGQYFGTKDTNNFEIIASKGKDTLMGAADWSNRVVDLKEALAAGSVSLTSDQTKIGTSADEKFTYTLSTFDVASNGLSTSYHADGTQWIPSLGSYLNTELYEKKNLQGTSQGYVYASTFSTDNFIEGDKWGQSIEIQGETINFDENGKSKAVSAYQLNTAYYFSENMDENKKVNLNGGAGNDLLIAGVSGGSLKGADGNDTLRTGATDPSNRESWTSHEGTYADVVLDGGAGNDTFVVTGEGNATINYANMTAEHLKAVKAEDDAATLKAAKALYGNDTIIFSYDKANAKEPQAQIQISTASFGTSSYGTDALYFSNSYDLTLGVEGKVWTGDTSSNGFSTNAEGKVVLRGLREGTIINAQIGGQKYTQKFTTAETLKSGEVSGNINGFFAPNATKIVASEKGGVVIGNTNTTAIEGSGKKDTLIANAQGATLKGGASADVFDVTGNIGTVAIQDYSASEKDLIKVKVEDIHSAVVDNTGILFGLGDDKAISVKGAAGGEVSFTFDNEEGVATTANGKTTWKLNKTTDVMARTFSKDTKETVVSAGATATALKTFEGADDHIKLVDASKTSKLTKIQIGNAAIETLKAGKGNEYITFSTLGTSAVVEVATGAGNDTVSVVGGMTDAKGIYVTDFAKLVLDNNKKYKSGDVLAINENDFKDADGYLSESRVTFDGQDVTFVNEKITLKGMKNQEIAYIDSSEYGTKEIKTIKLENVHEYPYKNNTKFENHGSDYEDNILKTNVDSTSNSKGAVVEGKNFVKEILAGKAVDTIVAGFGGNTVQFATNDIYANSSSIGTLNMSGGAGADFFVFNNMARDYHFSTFDGTAQKERITGISNVKTLKTVVNGTDTIDIYEDNKGNTYKIKAVADNDNTYELYTGYEVSAFGTAKVHYSIKDYDGDKIVFSDEFGSVSISSAYLGTTTYESTKATVKGSEVVTNYSDVTLVLTDGNEINLEKVAVDNSDKNATSFKVTRASSADAKTFFKLDFVNDKVTISGSDGTDFFDVSGAAADTIVAANTKAITIGGVGNDRYTTETGINKTVLTKSVEGKSAVTVNGLDAPAAISFYGNYGLGTQPNVLAQETLDVADKFTLGTNGDEFFGTATFNLDGVKIYDTLNGGELLTFFDKTDSYQIVFSTSSLGGNIPSLQASNSISALSTNKAGKDNYTLELGTNFITYNFTSAGIETYGLNTAVFGTSITFNVGVYGTDGNLLTDNLSGAKLDDKKNINIGVSYSYSLAGWSEQDRAAHFIGGSKNDVYVGDGSKDTVDFRAGGNNTIFGGRADVTLGEGNNADVIVLGAGDDVTISNYFNSKSAGGLDKVYLDTVFGGDSQNITAHISTMYFSTSANTKTKPKENQNLILEFDGEIDGNGLTPHAKITFADYKKNEQPAVYVGQRIVTDKAKGKTKIQGLSQASYLGSGGEVYSIGGTAANDTIEVGVFNVTQANGGGGANTFIINSKHTAGVDNAAVIENFTAKDTILYRNSDNEVMALGSLANLSDDYAFTGEGDATVRVYHDEDDSTKDQYVVLKNSGAKNGKATNKIKYGNTKGTEGAKGIALSNQANVILGANKTSAKYDLASWGWSTDSSGVTETFDARKAGKSGVEVYANSKLTEYYASAGKDTVHLSSIGDDKTKLNYTFTAQANLEDTIEFNTAIAEKNFGITYAAGLTQSYASDGPSGNSNEVTINVAKGTKDQGKITLVDNSDDGGLFEYGYYVTKGKTYRKGEKGTDDYNTMLVDYAWYKTVKGVGIDGVATLDSDEITGANADDDNVLWEIGDAIGLGTEAEVGGSAKNPIIFGSSFGADKYYLSTALGTLGMPYLGTSGAGYSYTFGTEVSGLATVRGSGDGFYIEAIQLNVLGTDFIVEDGKFDIDKSADGKITIAFSTYTNNGFKFGTEATGNDRKNMVISADASGLHFSVDDVPTSSYGTFAINETFSTATAPLTNADLSGIAGYNNFTAGFATLGTATLDTSAIGTAKFELDSNGKPKDGYFNSLSTSDFQIGTYYTDFVSFNLSSAGVDNGATWYLDTQGTQITIGNQNYTIKLSSSADSKVGLDDTFTIADQTSADGEISVGDRKFKLDTSSQGQIRLSTSIVTHEDIEFEINKNAFHVKFVADEIGDIASLGTSVTLVREEGTIESKLGSHDGANIVFDVEGIGGYLGKETFYFNTSTFDGVTWAQETFTRKFQLGTGDQYTVYYGTDDYGNSTHQITTIAFSNDGSGDFGAVELDKFDFGNEHATFQISSAKAGGADTNFILTSYEALEKTGSVTWTKTVVAKEFSFATSSLSDKETTFYLGFATDAYGNSILSSGAGIFTGQLSTAVLANALESSNDGKTIIVGTQDNFILEGMLGTTGSADWPLGLGTIVNSTGAEFLRASTFTGFGTIDGLYGAQTGQDIAGVVSINYKEDNTFGTGEVTINKIDPNTKAVTSDELIGTMMLGTLTVKGNPTQTYIFGSGSGYNNTMNGSINWDWKYDVTGGFGELGTAWTRSSWSEYQKDQEARASAFEEREFAEYAIITAPETLFGSEEQLDDILEIKSNVDTASTDKQNDFDDKFNLAISADDFSSNKKKE